MVAANLVMISTDVQSGNILDYAKKPATLDMMASDSETPAPTIPEESLGKAVKTAEDHMEARESTIPKDVHDAGPPATDDSDETMIDQAFEPESSEDAGDTEMMPVADAEATVMLGMGSSFPGCETTDECYIPHTVTVRVGGSVTWINDDAGHTVTAGDIAKDSKLIGTAFPNGFDSGFFLAGNSYSHTFEEAGKYPYYCLVHPWMKGVVIVQ